MAQRRVKRALVLAPQRIRAASCGIEITGLDRLGQGVLCTGGVERLTFLMPGPALPAEPGRKANDDAAHHGLPVFTNPLAQALDLLFVCSLFHVSSCFLSCLRRSL